VQPGEATGTPKSHDGPVEALRTLKAVQRSANKARTQALNQIHQLLVTAPEDLRARLRPLSRADLLAACAAFRISPDDDSLPAMTRLALRELAERIAHLAEQLTLVGKRLHRITAAVAPQLVAIKGVGPEVASTLLMTAGDNPQRMHTEAAFAALYGSNPIPASSGKTHRHRLNRAGDRQANAALRRIVIVRLSYDQRTRDYLDKRTIWKARARPKRSAASSATSPARSTTRCPQQPRLDSRSIAYGGSSSRLCAGTAEALKGDLVRRPGRRSVSHRASALPGPERLFLRSSSAGRKAVTTSRFSNVERSPPWSRWMRRMTGSSPWSTTWLPI